MLPHNIMEFLKSNINVYCTRNMEKGGLIVPRKRPVTYGDKTLRYTVPTVWNKYIKFTNYDYIRSIYHFKSHLKKWYLNRIILNCKSVFILKCDKG